MLWCLTFRLDWIVPDDFPRHFRIGPDGHGVEQAVLILRCFHVHAIANFKAVRLRGLLGQFNSEHARVVGLEIQGLCVQCSDNTSVCARGRLNWFVRGLLRTAAWELCPER
jgi:hypothetical protein